MFARLMLLFVLVPIADLALLLWLARWLTFWPTVAVVLSTASLGAWFARQQLRQLAARANQNLGNAAAMGPLFGDTVMILFAAALLITPGLITDLVGLLLLVPAARRGFQRFAGKWFLTRLNIRIIDPASLGGFPGPGDDTGTVEGTVNRPSSHTEDAHGPNAGSADPWQRPSLPRLNKPADQHS